MRFSQKRGLLMRGHLLILGRAALFAAAGLFFVVAQGQKAPEATLTLARPLVFKWVFDGATQLALRPGFDGEALYFQSPEGVVTSAQLPGGQLRWRSELGGVLSAPPAAGGRAVYAATESITPTAIKNQGVITALSKSNGITLWSKTLTSPLQSDLLLSENALFGVTKESRLFCLDSESGETRWDTQLPYSLSENLLLTENRLVASTADGIIVAFNTQTGIPVWRYRTQGLGKNSISVAGTSVFVGSSDGYVTALEETAAGINFRWRRRAGTSVVGVTSTAGGIVVVTGDNFVQMLSHKRGSRLWKQRMPGRVFPRPLIEAGNALFASLGGDACFVLSLERGRRVNYLSVGEGNSIVAMPVLTPSLLVIPTRLGLMAFAQPGAG